MNHTKAFLIVSSAVCSLLALGLPVTADAQTAPYVLYIKNTGSSDGNGGKDQNDSLRTLRKAHQMLVDYPPVTDVDILIGPGTYYCRGMWNAVTQVTEHWTFNNGHTIRIKPLNAVTSPAIASADDVNRPIFSGLDEEGNFCGGHDAVGNPIGPGVWMALDHDGKSVKIEISGLKIQKYRGAIYLTNTAPGATSSNSSQDIKISNMVFQRIGDFYNNSNGTGYAALLVTKTSGVDIEDNYFDQIRNTASGADLLHAIYFSQFSSNNLINNNVFHGGSGSAIKLTHYSNDNVFTNNSISYFLLAVKDRWCGSRPENGDDKTCIESPAGPQCPSWNNEFALGANGNTVSSLTNTSGSKICIDAIPANQTCDFPQPSPGTPRFIYGSEVINSGCR